MMQIEAESGIAERILREADIFRNLSDDQIAKVSGLARRIKVPAGRELGVAGSLGADLLVIISGHAELAAHSGIGKITVRVAGSGESFPLATLLGSGTLITSVEAMTDMELLVIPRSSLLTLCSEDSEIGMRLYAGIADLFANRYRNTLTHLTINAERALKDAGFFANV